ncbi:hypothetical protein C8N46_10217 [Kordia periserrulae]|uniref:Uncharacterized protein n=1 Tax=Kordia periserrulae TaxID=701523 RepID=A0A2T6C2R7_9FLAO|nr:hypothetical protein [Kordia periserrulae]PTX62622.1 hypothetical protein C8N46_10217 [Kordia periserrulae]
MAAKKIIKVKRVINYYQLDFKFLEENNFQNLFDTITSLSKTRAKIRYQRFGDKFVFIQGIENNEKLLKAKMRCVRKDLLPELMNTTTDETKGIDAKEEEGLVETTHFIIDYRKDKIILGLEYNHYGSKITDMVNYIQRIGIYKGILENVSFSPIVKDDLDKLKKRINRFSEFIVKVHKDNVPKIKKLDNKIWQALDASIDNFDSDYATIILKFNYKQRSETPQIENSVINLINGFIKNRKDKYLFNKLSMKVEDEEKNNLLENFDLLIEKVNSVIKVERKPKYRTLVSTDMFEKMTRELDELNYK